MRAILVIALCLCARLAAATPPMVDSGSIHTNGASVSNNLTLTLVTASAPERIILNFGAVDFTSNGTPQATGVSGCGLSWSLRKRTTFINFTGGTYCHNNASGTCDIDQEEWTAYAASTIASCTVTIGFSTTPVISGGVYGLSGIPSGGAFDANAGLPAVATGTAITAVPNVSTSSVPSALFNFSSGNYNSQAGGTACSGWNTIWNNFQFYGALSIGISAGAGLAQNLCSTVSNISTPIWSVGCSTVSANIVTADAVQGIPSPGCTSGGGGTGNVNLKVN